MSGSLLREGTRRCHHLHRPSSESRTSLYTYAPQRQSSAAAGSVASTLSPLRQAQCTASTPHFRPFFDRLRDTVFSPSFPRAASASTSSSRPKNRLLGWYLGMIDIRPVLTKSITAGVIFAAADLSSQVIMDTPSFDLSRTLRMAGYGMLVLGPILHLWFNFISKVVPKQDILSTLKKIFIGQTTFGPTMTAIFFSVNAGLQGENCAEILSRLKRDMFPTMRNGLLYWPVADYVTFRFIPVHLQPVICNLFSFVWTVYLTRMASSKKANLDKISEQLTSNEFSISSLTDLERKQDIDEKEWFR